MVGYGSIGQRHARLLKEMGCEVAVVTHQTIPSPPYYPNLKQAIASWKPEYVVISNHTSEHKRTVEELIQYKFNGRLLVEKPLFDRSLDFPAHHFSHLAVAYNLRCHPLIKTLKAKLKNPAEIITASIYVGSFLPDWRPDRDYRQTCSAQKDKGGGVLRDLSHELDYAAHLFGPWQKLTASGGQFGRLEIDSDDTFSILMETDQVPLVTIHMNYLDRNHTRQIRIITDQESIHADLIKNTLDINNTLTTYDTQQDDTYRSQHDKMIQGNINNLCSIQEAVETLTTIEAAEKSTASDIWITK